MKHNITIHHRIHHRHQLGAAMSETLLALPLLLLVFVLIFFVGQSMSRLQRASVMDRYEAWRREARAPGPQAVQMDMQPPTWRAEQLNSAFFGGNAERVDTEIYRYFPSDASDMLVAEVGGFWPEAGPLVDLIYDRLPIGERVRFQTHHRNTVPILEQFAGPITKAHVFFGHEWKFSNRVRYDGSLDKWTYISGPQLSHMPVIRDEFFDDYNWRVGRLADNGNDLARLLQTFYLAEPPYRGPDFPANWWVNSTPP